MMPKALGTSPMAGPQFLVGDPRWKVMAYRNRMNVAASPHDVVIHNFAVSTHLERYPSLASNYVIPPTSPRIRTLKDKAQYSIRGID
jgi:hypothetical protein